MITRKKPVWGIWGMFPARSTRDPSLPGDGGYDPSLGSIYDDVVMMDVGIGLWAVNVMIFTIDVYFVSSLFRSTGHLSSFQSSGPSKEDGRPCNAE